MNPLHHESLLNPESALRLKFDFKDLNYTVYGPGADNARAQLEYLVQDGHETIDDLSQVEKSRLHIVFVPTAHVPQYAHEAILGLQHADFVLLEGVGASEEQRLHTDVVTNLAVQGFKFGCEPLTLTGYQLAMLRANQDWRSMVINGISRRRLSPPIFRSIDMAEDDPLFSPDIHSPKALMVVNPETDLFMLPLNQLRDKVVERLPIAAHGIYERDMEMYKDISKIAAQAVRLIDDRREVVIGVSVGAVHSLVARKLEAAGIDVTHVWSGAAARLNDDVFGGDSAHYSFDLDNALMRKVTYMPERFDAQDVDCLLTYMYVKSALLEGDIRLAMRATADMDTLHGVEMVASEAVYRMKPEQRSDLLESLNKERAGHRLPFFRAFRIESAKRRMLPLTIELLEQKVGPLSKISREVIDELMD